jgi:hypothetical protein
MSKPYYNPRNRNIRYDSAPLSWSQAYYDRERPKPEMGFKVKDGGTKV